MKIISRSAFLKKKLTIPETTLQKYYSAIYKSLTMKNMIL